jgi:hypothetical protein
MFHDDDGNNVICFLRHLLQLKLYNDVKELNKVAIMVDIRPGRTLASVSRKNYIGYIN